MNDLKADALRLFALFIFIYSQVAYSQENSEAYLNIINSATLSNELKEKHVDSLIYQFEQSKKNKYLVVDLYSYAKWQNQTNQSIDKAIEVSKKCVRLFENLPPDFNENIYKRTINNLGGFYERKQDYINSLETFKKAAKVGKSDDWTADAYRLIGRNLRFLGDFYEAVDYYETSIKVAREIDFPNIYLINCVDASINYKRIGTKKSIERGIEILNEAIEFANTNEIKKRISPTRLYTLYEHLGNLYNEREDYNFEKSKFNYNKSLELALQIKRPSLLALTYNDLGYLYLQDGDKEALTYLNKALENEPQPWLASTILENKSTYFLKSNQFEKALQNIQLAIKAIVPSLVVDDLTHLPSQENISINSYKYELLKDIITKGKIWLALFDASENNHEYLQNALKTFQLADELVDIIRFESTEQRSKLFWRKTAAEIYSNAVRASFELNNNERAFYFMEKNKAILLLENVSYRKQKSNLPNRFNERELLIRSQISILNKSLRNAEPEKKDSIRTELLRVKGHLSQFMDSIGSLPGVFTDQNKPASILPLRETQNSLRNDKRVYLEYILGTEFGYGLLVAKEKAQLFKIGMYDTLNIQAQKFRELLEKPLITENDLAAYTEVAHSLFNLLVPESIRPLIDQKNIVIIGDSYLQNIPFEALLTSKDANSFLIKDHEISYAYSVSFLQKNKSIDRKNKVDFLGFAPIEFSATNLSDLPYTRSEMQTAEDFFKSNTFLQDRAIKQNFLDNSLDHSIIHLASHADASSNSEPWISFSDSKLSLDELYLTANTAELVVLSACNTSLGRVHQGEGVMSLARGFFTTGANSVLATLWNVNDKSSETLIADFYHEIKKGKSKSSALHQAKLNYLNSHQLSELSPYYWSSFVLIGDANDLPLQGSSLVYYILIFIFILLIASLLIYYSKKK